MEYNAWLLLFKVSSLWHSADPDFHSLFYKLFILAVSLKSERLLISIILSHNVMASLAAVYQERANFLIYQLDYKQENFFPYCNAITIIIEGLLEAAKLDSFKS